MPTTKKTLELLDLTIEQSQESSFRNHLGASIIGRKCQRELWYTFRWAKQIRFKPRMVRLFERGNLEELRWQRWFKAMGVEVYTKHKNGKQFRVVDVYGHFGGSLDGMGKGIPDLPAQPFVFEFKTYKEQLFKQLLKDKVKKHKWDHYVQMQIYMFKRKLKWALYCAINKNDDSIYLEIVRCHPEIAKEYIERAEYIIFTEEPPVRISSNPRWHECLQCSYHSICHSYDVPAINCRTCAHSTPIKNKNNSGTWDCQLGNTPIDTAPQDGCSYHVFTPHILNGIDYGEANLDENYIVLKMPNGEVIKHGPNHVSSKELKNYYTRG